MSLSLSLSLPPGWLDMSRYTGQSISHCSCRNALYLIRVTVTPDLPPVSPQITNIGTSGIPEVASVGACEAPPRLHHCRVFT